LTPARERERVLPYYPHTSGPIQWARGDVGLKPSAAARPSNGKVNSILFIAEWASTTPIKTLTPDVIFIPNEIKKPSQNGRKMTSFRGAMGWHGQAGSWRGQ